MQIKFGALSPPLHEQLDVPEDVLKTEQKLADGISLCSIHSILTSAETHNARKRLTKRINKTLIDSGHYE